MRADSFEPIPGSPSQTRATRRTALTAGLAGAVGLAGLSTVTAAQDATPEAESATYPMFLFVQLAEGGACWDTDYWVCTPCVGNWNYLNELCNRTYPDCQGYCNAS